MAVQAVVIVQMAGQRVDDNSLIRTVPVTGGTVDQGPYLKVNFKGEAREAEMRLLLVEVHGSLAAGPGQLGDYYVCIVTPDRSSVANKLRASGIVDAVMEVDGLPPRP